MAAMRARQLLRIVCLVTGAVLAIAPASAEPLQFRWPLPASARVTQATIDDFGNFSVQFDLTAKRSADGKAIRVSAGGYRLLYHNRLLLEGYKLDGFNMLNVLHRLAIPSVITDRQGRMMRIEPADPQEIERAFLQNVSSPRVASLREWFVARRPDGIAEVRQRAARYWRVQIPYWEYWVGKWQALFGPAPLDLEETHLLYLAGLRIPGRTRLIDRSPAPDCPDCIAVAAQDHFSREDLKPYADELAQQLGLSRGRGSAPMTGMRAFVRTEAIIDWQTMLPYRVQAMTIAFQDLADGRVVAYDQTKHFFFEWHNFQAVGTVQ